MNKNAIQKYAIWARNELRDQITQKAYRYGITPDEKPKRGLESVNNFMLSPVERKQRDQLVDLVLSKNSNPKEAFDQMVEEVAYTWFNRLIALRFMEVNDYLPEHVRILSSPKNEFKPEIITSALSLDEKHFNKDLILRLLDEGKQEELYRYLLLAQCNALNDILPVMFEKMDGYTELLLPSNLLKADSVIGKLISDIDENDWRVTDSSDEESGQVQIIGWLYQYYNSELKDQTFADLKKKNKKISKERIPAATQLFTPDWIVRYMVENSLGRLWLEGHPNEELKKNWKYYLDEAEQEPEVEAQLAEIRKDYSKLKLEDLSVADIAMGSGHILVYAFDVLMQIYRSQGVRDREAVKSILENNLYGLDVDDRAAQLAYFAVMMKAREFDRRILTRGIQPNLYAVRESNDISKEAIDYFAGNDDKLQTELNALVNQMMFAKEYGSLTTVSKYDFKHMDERLLKIDEEYHPFAIEVKEKIKPLVKSAKLLSRTFSVIVMNPPYIGLRNLSKPMFDKMMANYKTTKNDLYGAFLQEGLRKLNKRGFLGIITQHSWMFLSSFEQFRKEYLKRYTPISVVHLGTKAFEEISGEVVQTVAFVTQNDINHNYKTDYRRLVSLDADKKRKNLLDNQYRFFKNARDFSAIPGSPISYWMPEKVFQIYKDYPLISEISNTRQGLKSSDDKRFIRYLWEVDDRKIAHQISSTEEASSSGKKWFLLNKGGQDKWYGNYIYLINWENDGEEIKNYAIEIAGSYSKNITAIDTYFKQCISWPQIAMTNPAFRIIPDGYIFASAGPSLFVNDKNLQWYVLGLLNSQVANYILDSINPTINFGVSDILKIPFVKNEEYIPIISERVKKSIKITQQEYDEHEYSLGFSGSPLCQKTPSLAKAYRKYRGSDSQRRSELEDLERKNNLDFLKIYHLDMNNFENGTPIDLPYSSKRDLVTGLISYAIGNLFGRYSVDNPKLTQANPELNNQNYKSFQIDTDNIIPIGEDEYFEDDLSLRFIEWVKIVYGDEYLEENLQFIADALGGKGTSRAVIRNYFLNSFFFDHCKAYKKRPIYWLFDSGKKNGFKCLIYMHRYQPDLLARIRTDYVLEQQERYRSQIKHLKSMIDEAPKSEQVKIRKQLKDLEAKSAEVAVFEEKLHHLADQMIEIDLDDGIKHNYALFQDVLAKIK